MAKTHAQSWEVTDEFWKRVEPLIPQPARDPAKQYLRRPGGGAPPNQRAWFLKRSCTCSERAASGRRCPVSALAAPARCTTSSCNGPRRASLRRCGRRALPSTTSSKVLPGAGKASTGQCSKRRWHKKLSVRTRRIGGKNGSKRHLLVDGHGVPLSLLVTGANVHDVTQIEAVLEAIVVKRPSPKQRRSRHLCADAGYRGKDAMTVILAHGYIPHVVSRKNEVAQKKRDPKKKARRWVVDLSWLVQPLQEAARTL